MPPGGSESPIVPVSIATIVKPRITVSLTCPPAGAPVTFIDHEVSAPRGVLQLGAVPPPCVSAPGVAYMGQFPGVEPHGRAVLPIVSPCATGASATSAAMAVSAPAPAIRPATIVPHPRPRSRAVRDRRRPGRIFACAVAGLAAFPNAGTVAA